MTGWRDKVMGYTAESREREGIHNTGSCESIQKNGKVFVVVWPILDDKGGGLLSCLFGWSTI